MDEFTVVAARTIKVRSPDTYSAVTDSLNELNEETLGKPWTVDDIVSINNQPFYRHQRGIA